MIIINSGAYVNSEFQSEFGRIPPSMLPLGNRKLIEHQVQSLRSSFPEEYIVLSLPASFEEYFTGIDAGFMSGISIVFVPDVFSLAESILYILNLEGRQDSTVRLLHGDTLFTDYSKDIDIISVASSPGEYLWELDSNANEENLIWSGFFSFSSSLLLVKSLAIAQGDFIAAVKNYESIVTMTSELMSDWYDLGHINTYFKSRSKITTQRSFNSLEVKDGVVLKKGNPAIKIASEGLWFQSLPSMLKKYTPQLIDMGEDKQGRPFYSIEYLTISPLNEVFVHGKNPAKYWAGIFSLCGSVMNDFRLASSLSSDTLTDEVNSLYRDKSIRRLEEYAFNCKVDLEVPVFYESQKLPSLINIAKECISLSMEMPIIPAVLHGDFCFSNVLYDSRSNGLKLIDPRALNESNQFILEGDQKYDLAKLSHSVIGLYDFIIAGRYEIIDGDLDSVTLKFHDQNRLEEIQDKFLSTSFIPGIATSSIMPITILLFLSMLPLHSDKPDRQKAMLLNAVRLYNKYIYKTEIKKDNRVLEGIA